MLPMNSNNQPNTTTIIESPIWIGRYYTFLPTFWITWFVMFGLAGLIGCYFKVPEGFGDLFFTSFPILISLYIDEKFVQHFLMPSWESSKLEDQLSIRGILYPKIREWIEWSIKTRKRIIVSIAFVHITLTIFSTSGKYSSGMLLCFIVANVVSLPIRTWLGFKKFGFMSWYISGVASLRSQQ